MDYTNTMHKYSYDEYLSLLYRENKAVFAYNIQNFYQLDALSSFCDKSGHQVICQISAKFARHYLDQNAFNLFANREKYTRLFFHLDHCDDFDLIKTCVDTGFHSVMYDGSHRPLEENIENSKHIVEYAHASGCLVEGEIGSIGGIEDGFGSSEYSYATPDIIETYVKATNVDLIAPGIGNIHGDYSSFEHLKIELLDEIDRRIKDSAHMVLHGGTGLNVEQLGQAISYGVVKINVSTELKKDTANCYKAVFENMSHYDELKLRSEVIQGLEVFFAKKQSELESIFRK